VNEGERLAKGAVLARLDQRALKAQEAAAQANVTAAKAAFADARASSELAQATTRRQKQLLDKGHISPQRFDDARFAAASAQARANTAKAQILQAKAQLESARVALSLSELRAPFDGVVVQRMADEGSILAPGAPIFDFEESARYEFVTGVPAGLVASLAPGQAAQVTIGGGRYSGQVKQIVGALDGATRTAQLIIDLPEGTNVVSGQVGQLEINVRQSGQGFWVPIEALQEGERGLWSVFIAEPPRTDEGRGVSILQRHPVELLYAEIERAYVRGSIRDGDHLVVSGLNRLISGQRVRTKTPLESR
jgi:RND family efflux transporter MFP subunit